MRSGNVIESFDKEDSFLSNFFELHPHKIQLGDLELPTSEHGYQISKTLDLELRKELAEIPSASHIKKICKSIPIRPDWNDVKLKVMEQILIQKFSKEPFRTKLLNTKDMILIEGNLWHDNFWGSCHCQRCGNNGKNNLGKLLMKIRNGIINENKNRENWINVES